MSRALRSIATALVDDARDPLEGLRYRIRDELPWDQGRVALALLILPEDAVGYRDVADGLGITGQVTPDPGERRRMSSLAPGPTVSTIDRSRVDDVGRHAVQEDVDYVLGGAGLQVCDRLLRIEGDVRR